MESLSDEELQAKFNKVIELTDKMNIAKSNKLSNKEKLYFYGLLKRISD